MADHCHLGWRTLVCDRQRVVGLGGALTGTMKRLPQLGDLGRSSTLNAGIDVPGITASRRDEFSEIYML
ncbi:hypothetical protein ACT16_19515 [Mycobacterium heckeshornense]|nr:hypothetical protein ACT16_19515 [Mycobacterium heckeshornense]